MREWIRECLARGDQRAFLYATDEELKEYDRLAANRLVPPRPRI